MENKWEINQRLMLSPAATMILALAGSAAFILVLASFWRIFTKAGQPGWASFIPFLNFYILVKIAEKPGWWFVLLLVPFVNVVFFIMVIAAVAENFGKGSGFIIGLIFLPFIFYPMLAFSDAAYGAQAAGTNKV